MADNEGDVEETAGDDAVPEKKGSKKKLFIIIGVVLLLVIGGGAGAYFMGLFDAEVVQEDGAVAKPVAPKTVYQYYELPEMLINLQAIDGQIRFLKILINQDFIHISIY